MLRFSSVQFRSVAQLCLTLYDPMNHSTPVHERTCGSWGRKESDTTERLNGTELKGNDCHGNKKGTYSPSSYPI